MTAAGGDGAAPAASRVGGLFDVPASALGSGAATAGEAAVTLGTSLTHRVLVEGPQADSSGIGMALGLGFGEYPSLGAAVGEMVTIDRRYTPREAHVPRYDDLYELFVDVRTGMAPLWSRRAETYRCLRDESESGSDAES